MPPDSLLERYSRTRGRSIAACEPLAIEDYGLQAEDFTSPPKWHLAHTTWFFETFLLKPYLEAYSSPEPAYEVLFNSYYNGIGEQFPRPRRGLLSRPTVEEVLRYREQVDAAMAELLNKVGHESRQDIEERTVLGIEHECQHQELFFTDLKYSLAVNPLQPVYQHAAKVSDTDTTALRWLSFEGGLSELGYAGDSFCFDNELPRHRCFLEPFEITNRLVTNAEFAEFIADGGYRRPELWLADGWTTAQQHGWQAPHYWRDVDGEAMEYTLHGLRPRVPSEPVCHVSGYEADAFARWADARLPTEAEWETAAAGRPVSEAKAGSYHPSAASATAEMSQLYDACWQWTRSAYSPYPGYKASPGAIGEYNGKFMSNQWVLRGGSCASSPGHLRPSYRNFFYPPDRWQFSGIRLARDINRYQG
ncbi:MAG: ergothioneine biosynthesis protein EgtB [Pseudomonadota bacterium]